jgi:pimeloyl-ACP methyl ester carboxylesterase
MAFAPSGELTIYYETFGSTTDPTLLLVSGLGSQCIYFPVEWCELLAGNGFHVVRFDNRDIGLSTHLDDMPTDDQEAVYRLEDMAGDAVAVLDHLGVERAHVFGASLGGMIVQELAIHYRERLLSMTSVMSRPGDGESGLATAEAWEHLTSPAPPDRESAIASDIKGKRIWGSPEFLDESRTRRQAGDAHDRCNYRPGRDRQLLANRVSGSRVEGLRTVTTPSLVIHGDHDTLIDVSGGLATAELIPDASMVVIAGMGHDFPPQLWPRFLAEVTSFVDRLSLE